MPTVPTFTLKRILGTVPVEADGGWELCRDQKSGSSARVCSNWSDPDYQALLVMVTAGVGLLAEDKRFDKPGFVPRTDWVRELKRHGVLTDGVQPGDIIQVHGVETKSWQSLWHQPEFPPQASQEEISPGRPLPAAAVFRPHNAAPLCGALRPRSPCSPRSWLR